MPVQDEDSKYSDKDDEKEKELIKKSDEAAKLMLEAMRKRLGERKQEFDHIMQYFEYTHLPEHLQAVSKPFCELAQEVLKLPCNPERSTALRKLLEAKDCAVRAKLAK